MNMSTIIVTGLVALAVIAAIVHQVHKKRQGKSSCGCGCSGCSMSGFCHEEDRKE
ncbi:MAG: FeoB-associated Cys-rich membrane protein [Lentihominibacter sp.]|jgi:hypothetical protein